MARRMVGPARELALDVRVSDAYPEALMLAGMMMGGISHPHDRLMALARMITASIDMAGAVKGRILQCYRCGELFFEIYEVKGDLCIRMCPSPKNEAAEAALEIPKFTWKDAA